MIDSESVSETEICSETEKTALEYDDEHVRSIRDFIEREYDHMESTLMPSKLTATSIKGRYLDDEASSHTIQRKKKSDKQKRPSFLEETGMTGAERGIALHLAMQFIDFGKCSSRESIEREVQRLKDIRVLSVAQAESVEVDKIYGFFMSELGQKLLMSDKIQREFKFSLLCDKSVYEIGAEAVKISDIQGDSVLLQGVIDCYFELSDGTIAVLDFKTDNVNEAYLQRHVKNYEDQIKSYAYALERITNKHVSESYLYFFKTESTVKMRL